MTKLEKCSDCSIEKEKNDFWEIDGGKFYLCTPCFKTKNFTKQVDTPKNIVTVDNSLRCKICNVELTTAKAYMIDGKPFCGDCAWQEHKKGTYKSFYPPEMIVEKEVYTTGKKWLIDENLRKKDRSMEDPDCLTTLDILPKGSPDTDIIRKARELGLIIVTRDIRLTLNCVIRGQSVVFQDFHGNRHLIKREIEKI
jgi:hypothetical protein